MNRRSFIKNLGLLTGVLAISPTVFVRELTKNPLKISGAFAEAKRRHLRRHAIEMERAFLFGINREVTFDGN